MVVYYAGENDEHRVDHAPIFACREHKCLLRLSSRFVAELLASGEDVMPGNPDEVVGAYVREVAGAYRLPDFLVPPKLILFNPRGLRGADALPYTLVLIDKRFYGIPARYLSADRFEGCDECAASGPQAARRPPARAPGPGSSSSDVGRPLAAAPPRGPADSGIRRGPADSGIRRAGAPPGAPGRPQGAPPPRPPGGPPPRRGP